MLPATPSWLGPFHPPPPLPSTLLEGQPRPLDKPHRRKRSHSLQDHPPSPRVPRDSGSAYPGIAQPEVDAALAFHPSRPFAEPLISWDVIYDPRETLSRSRSVSQYSLSRPAVYLDRQPLQALTLIIPRLSLRIDVAPALRQGANPSDGVTVIDVLEGLYRALRKPLDAREFMGLGRREQAALMQAAEERCTRFPADGRKARDGILRVDYLGRERKFRGLRPAASHELPPGTPLGKVYVLEFEKSNI